MSFAGRLARTASRVACRNTNESFIGELSKRSNLEIDDPKAALSFVLQSLPPEVNVFPTENYYYFNFYHNGLNYSGNIRLDASDRDDGILHFTYFRGVSDKGRMEVRTLKLGHEDDLLMKKMDPFTYRIDYKSKSTVFHLNNLSDVRPNSEEIGKNETYIGPIFDESGVQFFLIFNNESKTFQYILGESENSLHDELVDSAFSDRIKIGIRTNFAFYQDHLMNRLILVGVLEHNVRINNYYDGPFDQLPDNFIKGDEFSNAFRLSNPTFPFAIDQFGKTSASTRVLIQPYVLYRAEDDLRAVERCAERFWRVEHTYYRCFDQDQTPERNRLHLPSHK